MKDDNLGLGAKRGKAGNETFGLSAFQGLLGRLNGKSDGELKKEESIQRDLKLKTYQNQRWGSIQFVSGGLLVGDKIEDVIEQNSPAVSNPSAIEPESPEGEKSAKKRKRTEDHENAPKLKKKKRKSDLRKEHDLSSPDDSEITAKKKSKSKKSKKSKDVDPSPDNSTSLSPSAEEKDDKEKPDKEARKEAKRAIRVQRQAKKEARKSEKEKRRQKKGKQEGSSSESASSDDEATTSTTGSTATVRVVQPATNFAGGRLAVRQRYIAQKKRASMDPQALKEIFMIKAEA